MNLLYWGICFYCTFIFKLYFLFNVTVSYKVLAVKRGHIRKVNTDSEKFVKRLLKLKSELLYVSLTDKSYKETQFKCFLLFWHSFLKHLIALTYSNDKGMLVSWQLFTFDT